MFDFISFLALLLQITYTYMYSSPAGGAVKIETARQLFTPEKSSIEECIGSGIIVNNNQSQDCAPLSTSDKQQTRQYIKMIK